jgi:hypothetical protein
MSRYYEVDEETQDMLEKIQDEYFSELANCYVKPLFDTKGKKSGGEFTFAWIKKSNELIRYLTSEEVDRDEGHDFIIFIDYNIWQNINEIDKERILRHELRHIEYDPESTSNPFKLRKHEVEDFYSEIELNKDEPRWKEKIGQIAESIYAKDE